MNVYTLAAHQPLRNAWQFSVVSLYCKSVSIPFLLMLHLFQFQTGVQTELCGSTMCTSAGLDSLKIK